MTKEEKAKHYDEALERARKIYDTQDNKSPFFEAGLTTIFPELAESEDERIRKEIVLFLREGIPYHCPNSVKRQEWANWLEKQGEQKNSTDRFFEGFRQGEQCVIEQPGKYGLQKQGERKPYKWDEWDEKIYNILHEEYENRAHWTHSREQFPDINGEILGWLELVKNGTIHKQKPAWSEEDEKNMETLINVLYAGTDLAYEREINWLKSLKDRVLPQLQQEWSEEKIETCAREAEDNNCIILAKHIRQLKSLRPQNRWKPSKGQMKALYSAASCHVQHDADLCSLYNDLEKLIK